MAIFVKLGTEIADINSARIVHRVILVRIVTQEVEQDRIYYMKFHPAGNEYRPL